MADINFDNPAFEPDVDEDTDITSIIGPDEVGDIDNTAPLDMPSVGQATGISLQQELLQTAVDDYFNTMANKRGLTPTLGRNPSNFEFVNGRLRLKAYPDIALTNVRTGEPLMLSTIANRPGGGKAIREELGFTDWQPRKSLPAKAATALQKTNDELGAIAGALATESIELEDLGAAAQNGKKAADVVELTLTDIDELLETVNDPPLNLRELRGLDKALQTIRGELVNNLAKLTALDEHIATENRKLREVGDDELSRRRIAERIRNLEDEKAIRLEAASASRGALRSQVNRIRETFSRILNEDTTLAERVRTLFREQGITIVTILTAIGMAISTLVLAITGGSGAAPAPTPAPSDKGGFKEWVKKSLHALGRILAKLASKAAAALPGIIGSVVSWLLSFLAKTAGWVAENTWAMVLAVGGLILLAAREWLSKKPKRD